jgi:hypothetical protein
MLIKAIRIAVVTLAIGAAVVLSVDRTSVMDGGIAKPIVLPLPRNSGTGIYMVPGTTSGTLTFPTISGTTGGFTNATGIPERLSESSTAVTSPYRPLNGTAATGGM